MWLQRKYLQQASSRLSRFQERGDDFNFRCPYCGDSKKSETKARGWMKKGDDGSYRFYCYNCQESHSFLDFLKTVMPHAAGEYTAESFKRERPAEHDRATLRAITAQPKFAPRPKKASPLTRFPSASPGADIPWAAQYLRERLIPVHHWKNIFAVEDVRDISTNIEAYKDTKLRGSRAILLPFYGNDGGLSYIQARLIGNDGLRYMTFELSGGDKLWGRHLINPAHHIYVFEGAFDAMFIRNACASGGADLVRAGRMIETEYPSTPFSICFDADWTKNRQVYDQVVRAIESGMRVTLYTGSHKDINDWVLAGAQQEDIETSLRRATISGLKARLEVSRIKRPYK